MPPEVALLLTVAFILWLLARDLKARPSLSQAIWIPLLWLLIMGSRPMSVWLGVQQSVQNMQLEGSPFDRSLSLLLIIAGLIVLIKRRVHWSGIIADNKWLFIFLLYLGLSALWADYPFVAFKRWIQYVANIIFVLVILSETNPVEAIRAVFLRFAFVLVPLSLVLIKYFPNLGRYYDDWGWAGYGGVTTNKNMLGITLLISSLGLFWEMLELHDDQTHARKKFELFPCLLLLGMVAWLHRTADTKTPLLCTLLAAGILLAVRFPSIKARIHRMGFYVPALAVLLVLGNSAFDLTGTFIQGLGRDSTLSGRTEIWQRCLSVPINPLVGTGYYSFWLDPSRVDKVSEDFWFRLNEAHNGYIETYLNEGLIGLFLLAALLIFALWKLKDAMLNEEGVYPALRLAILVIILFYNFTEAVFDRTNLIWFAALTAIIGRLPPLLVAQETSSDRPQEEVTNEGPRAASQLPGTSRSKDFPGGSLLVISA
jgi:exopolysaccharide production protein ExoQ